VRSDPKTPYFLFSSSYSFPFFFSGSLPPCAKLFVGATKKRPGFRLRFRPFLPRFFLLPLPLLLSCPPSKGRLEDARSLQPASLPESDLALRPLQEVFPFFRYPRPFDPFFLFASCSTIDNGLRLLSLGLTLAEWALYLMIFSLPDLRLIAVSSCNPPYVFSSRRHPLAKICRMDFCAQASIFFSPPFELFCRAHRTAQGFLAGGPGLALVTYSSIRPGSRSRAPMRNPFSLREFSRHNQISIFEEKSCSLRSPTPAAVVVEFSPPF